ncbi:alpha-acetolactate decarboxylase [Dendryphion nanum]|uniref:Alpha-acetolactate decarboxylase n=1 Tax=Dendryphion nanum TaxID=256645 RepID=A0A9P9DB23_9PLEO|nr:alpha-acetolactate decarboxylase [Dendryphion nanum]
MVASIPNDIFQFSTYSALQAGCNQGQPRTADLTSHGTHGIGTFEDGQLMILDKSRAYVVSPDGKVESATLQARLPFAMVTIFQPIAIIRAQSLTLDTLNNLLSSPENSGGLNTLMPFRLEAEFEKIGLSTGGHSTTANTYGSCKGVIVGFIIPNWMEHISGSRLHCHFLGNSGTQKVGGRVEHFETSREVSVGFARCGRFHLGFPMSEEWEQVKIN